MAHPPGTFLFGSREELDHLVTLSTVSIPQVESVLINKKKGLPNLVTVVAYGLDIRHQILGSLIQSTRRITS